MEKENERFLKESDSSDGLSEEENEPINIIDLNNNNSKRIPSQEKNAELAKIKQENLKIQNELVEDSSDEKSNEESVELDSFDENKKDLTHHCTYFGISSETGPTECKHQQLAEKKTISRTSCLNCEHKNELLDSLDHLAFLSPKEKELKKNFYDELKFDSPTKQDSLNESLIITKEIISYTEN